jgi:AAA ATPase domain
MRLLGRQAECHALDRLLTDAIAGQSGVMVLRGEAGIGKSALLAYVSERAQGMYVAKAVGVESEMELAYSGLQQLCGPMLDRLEQLPQPQRTALATVFGLSEGSAPDRFLVGLATLTLFADVAEHQPLVCIVEDAQWLDQASEQTLAFVSRRLLAERVAVVCAVRRGIGDGVLAGLPGLVVGQLGENDSLALLLENLDGPLDAAVCRRIVAESNGNPLALLEFPRTWSVAELAGGFGLPERLPLIGKIEESYIRRLKRLPPDTQILLLCAAAEPIGDPVPAPTRRRDSRDRHGGGRRRPGCRAAHGRSAWSSRTRSSAPPRTGPRPRTTATGSTARSPMPPTQRPTPTDEPGTAPAPPPGPTRTSPLSWSDPPAAPRLGVV